MSTIKTQSDLLDAAECAKAILNYSTLLGVLLAGPDAETAVDGMHQLMLEVTDLARTLKTILDRVSGGCLDTADGG
ncbi:hypothetical protein QY049_03505 [Bradyrhizobium sp. WYCCWR 13022]|uniref:hypothetical protein n=1 Tax=unclassified Bradyrhizobium TaxID=2631580 RepID=UPI00263B4EC4|nr:hypothetical protein [Bradyrhizobium sp. WYCCWR 13022]MDN4982289.1 hypothetical protein [Bradyrhizobium sp. WYCCWR 13022]